MYLKHADLGGVENGCGNIIYCYSYDFDQVGKRVRANVQQGDPEAIGIETVGDDKAPGGCM